MFYDICKNIWINGMTYQCENIFLYAKLTDQLLISSSSSSSSSSGSGSRSSSNFIPNINAIKNISALVT